MKLLFYIHAIKGGGAERVCVTLANSFAERGYEVYISCNTFLPIAYSIDEKVTVFNHRDGCENGRIGKISKTYRLLRMLWNMRQEAKRIRPDYVIGIMTDFTIYSAIALVGLKIPIIGCHHSAINRIGSKDAKLLDFIIPRIATMTVLTRHDYNIWKYRYNNIVRMPNPIDVNRNHLAMQRHKIVFTAGRVGSEPKGHENLMLIWNRVYKDNAEWQLHIAGQYDQETYDRLNSLLEKEAQGSVHFLGFRNDVYSLMQSAEIYILPSRWEGLPMGLMEAMNAGCCCIAYDVETGPSDIIRDGVNGVLVDNQNLNMMVEKLNKLLNNEEYRKKLASNAPSAIVRFDTSKVLDRWEYLFRLLERRK